MKRRRVCAEVPPIPVLSTRDLIFINEYFKSDLDATATYRKLHPNVTYDSAGSQSCRLLKKPQVQMEIARRMAAHGVTRKYLESSLMTYKAMADEARDYVAGAAIVMDAAKLAGLLVEKRQELLAEITQLTEEQIWAELEARLHAKAESSSLLPVPSPVSATEPRGFSTSESPAEPAPPVELPPNEPQPLVEPSPTPPLPPEPASTLPG